MDLKKIKEEKKKKLDSLSIEYLYNLIPNSIFYNKKYFYLNINKVRGGTIIYYKSDDDNLWNNFKVHKKLRKAFKAILIELIKDDKTFKTITDVRFRK